MKLCQKCKELKPLEDYGKDKQKADGLTSRCKTCRMEDALLSRYGVTMDEFEALVEKQNGVCAICGKYEAVLSVDHNHTTGKVRGLLCRQCNRGLGLLQDSEYVLSKALQYLQESEN